MSEKRVLIVDDSKDIGRMIAAALGTLDSGVQVKMMISAEEAVLEITRQSYDLLVIDIRLPGISGLDLTRRIRSRNPNLKIIQISGLDDPQVANEALQAGANSFFHKPISMSEFLKTTAVYLGLRAAESEVEVAADFQSEAHTGKMADVLSAARKALNAMSAVMIDGRGRVVIQAGKLPDPNLEFSLMPDLVEALQASLKVGTRLGEPQPGHALGFQGPAFHLLAAPILDGYALIIFLQSERPALRMAIAFEEALNAQRELDRLVQEGHPAPAARATQAVNAPEAAATDVLVSSGRPAPMPAVPAAEPVVFEPTRFSPPISTPSSAAQSKGGGTVVAPPSKPLKNVVVPAAAEFAQPPTDGLTSPETPIEVEKRSGSPKTPGKSTAEAAPAKAEAATAPAPQASLDESLDSLLRASANRRLETQEIDAFWDELAAQEKGGGQDDSEMISYEQAIRMGLAPKDAGK